MGLENWMNFIVYFVNNSRVGKVKIASEFISVKFDTYLVYILLFT